MIIKTNLIFPGFGAFTGWPFIFIKPAKATNAGLIEHEMVHYNEQKWITPFWWLAYLLSKKFRLNAELRAYKKQIEVGPDSIEFCASMLTKYKLGITFSEAMVLLKE